LLFVLLYFRLFCRCAGLSDSQLPPV
jgi:hypothetical protein